MTLLMKDLPAHIRNHKVALYAGVLPTDTPREAVEKVVAVGRNAGFSAEDLAKIEEQYTRVLATFDEKGV